MNTKTSEQIATPDQFAWGAENICKYLGRSKEATWWMLDQGKVPGAKKVAGRWGLHVPTFTAAFKHNAAA